MKKYDSLVAAVYDSPNDDAPRWALVEKLEKDQDPRGEFMRLQLEMASAGKASRASKSKQKELLKAHGESWRAPVSGVLVKRSVKWERGFPVSGDIIFPASVDGWDDIIGCPALATLRKLNLQKGNTVMSVDTMQRLLFDSALRHLRILQGIYYSFLSEFLRSSPAWELEQIDCMLQGGGGPRGLERQKELVVELNEAFASGKGLPRLVDLSLSLSHSFGQDPEKYEWLWKTASGRRLRAFGMHEQIEAFIPWHARLEELGDEIELQKLEISTGNKLFLERTKEGWTRLTGKMNTRNRWVDRDRRRLNTVLEQLGLSDVKVKDLEKE